MKKVRDYKMKRLVFPLMCLGFLAIIAMPGPAHATASSIGTAFIDWSQVVIATSNGATIDWSANALFGVDPVTGIPISTQGSSSGFGFVEGGFFNPYYTDFSDATPWSNTSVSLPDPSIPLSLPGVSLHADTGVTGTPPAPLPFDPLTSFPANELFTLSDITNTGNDVFAQAFLGGQFTVDMATTLTITVPFTLTQSLSNTGDGFSFSYVDAGLVLSDYNTTDPLTNQSLVLTSDIQSLSHTLIGPSLGFTASDTGRSLSLTYALQASVFDSVQGIYLNTYDFEAAVTARSAVPEPMTIILLGSGIMGLAILKRRFV